ncbi:MAG: GNAT family N-acetyltransferase [Pirellulales bacterium]
MEALSKKFKPSIHRNLRRAQSAGLRFARRSDADAVDEFYRLHVRTRRKSGVPVQPKRFFELLWKRVLHEGLGYVGLVFQGSEPIAAGVFLEFNNTVTYKYAASHPNALADRPNDWLAYNALRLAVENGYEALDFGISSRNQEGLRRFKRNWGADEIDVYTLQFVGRDKTPVEESALFKMSSILIRNSPAIVCRSLGEILYRFAM